MTGPRVTVVITLFNLRQFLGEAVESVFSQSIPAQEIDLVVIDDGSTDGGGTLAKSWVPRLRYLWQANQGLCAARNTGLAVAHAPFVVFLDADDRLHPDCLAAHLRVLEGAPDVTLAYGGARCVDVAGRPLPQRGWARAQGDILGRLVLGNVAPPVAFCARTDALRAAGGFDPTVTRVEDWDLWLRMTRAGARWACIDEVVADYRIRPGGMHHHAAGMLENRRAILDRVFAWTDLPQPVRALQPLAYQNALLEGAADHFQARDAEAGAAWFRAAVDVRPVLLRDSAGMERFARLLLPLGYQTGTLMAAQWHWIAGCLTQAIRAALAAPGRAHLARAAWLNYSRMILRLMTRAVRARIDPQRRRRTALQLRQLREFLEAAAAIPASPGLSQPERGGG